MSTDAEYRIVFRGSALAAGGQIRRPDVPFLSAAPSLVGVSGGRSEATTTAVRFGEVVSIDSAQSKVDADFQERDKAVKFTYGNFADNRLPIRTIACASLKGLQVFNGTGAARRTLTADKLSAELRSEWPGEKNQTSFPSIRASVLGLALDGFGLKVTFKTKPFTERDTKGKLEQSWQTSASFRRANDHLILVPKGQKVDPAKPALPQSAGTAYCTIVDKLAWVGNPNPRARINGHRIIFDGFGTIFVGEMIVSEFSRRLTLLRLELGSPWGGSIDIAELEVDGHGYPPY